MGTRLEGRDQHDFGITEQSLARTPGAGFARGAWVAGADKRPAIPQAIGRHPGGVVFGGLLLHDLPVGILLHDLPATELEVVTPP